MENSLCWNKSVGYMNVVIIIEITRLLYTFHFGWMNAHSVVIMVYLGIISTDRRRVWKINSLVPIDRNAPSSPPTESASRNRCQCNPVTAQCNATVDTQCYEESYMQVLKCSEHSVEPATSALHIPSCQRQFWQEHTVEPKTNARNTPFALNPPLLY